MEWCVAWCVDMLHFSVVVVAVCGVESNYLLSYSSREVILAYINHFFLSTIITKNSKNVICEGGYSEPYVADFVIIYYYYDYYYYYIIKSKIAIYYYVHRPMDFENVYYRTLHFVYEAGSVCLNSCRSPQIQRSTYGPERINTSA